MKQSFILTGSECEQIQKWIRKIGGCPEEMAGTPTGQVLEDIIGPTGKMIRSGLVLAIASIGGDPIDDEAFDRLCFLGALTELTHLASMIHDDIIDDAPLRRGRRSIQAEYGKDAAVYAGDFLIARINYWEAVMRCSDAAALLSSAVEKMCIGEIGQAMCRFDSETTCRQYYDNIKGKTAALFRAACRIGAISGGYQDDAKQSFVNAMDRFGEHFGILFQLRDDLLDFSKDSQCDGKATHKDFKDGIYTMPVLKAMEKEEGRRLLLPLMQANKERPLTDEEVLLMEETIRKCGGIDAAWDEIEQHAKICMSILLESDPTGSNEKIDRLKNLVRLLTEHEK